MVKKTITFEDLNGDPVTEDFYFYLNKAEVVKWLVTDKGCTLDKVLERITKERKASQIMDFYDDLLHRSYGIKSLDDMGFVKSEDIWNKFKSTEAYSAMFLELVTDAQKASDFLNAVIPRDLADEVNKIMEEQTKIGLLPA